MSRIASESRGLEWLVLLLCAAVSATLLALPEIDRVALADKLGEVLTGPYYRTRNFIADVGTVRGENADLAAAVVALELERDAPLRLRRERDGLREALGLVERAGGRLHPCEIVRRKSAPYAGLVQIHSSAPLDWRPYQAVMSVDGLIGRIRHVLGPRRAWAELLTAPDVALSCELERTGLQGILRSRAGDFDLLMVGRDEDVAVGDRVISSGVAELGDDERAGAPMPRGLPIGVVTVVSSPPEQLFKEIRVEPLASFHRHDVVFVVFGDGDWFVPAAPGSDAAGEGAP